MSYFVSSSLKKTSITSDGELLLKPKGGGERTKCKRRETGKRESIIIRDMRRTRIGEAKAFPIFGMNGRDTIDGVDGCLRRKNRWQRVWAGFNIGVSFPFPCFALSHPFMMMERVEKKDTRNPARLP